MMSSSSSSSSFSSSSNASASALDSHMSHATTAEDSASFIPKHKFELVLGQSVTGAWDNCLSDARAATARGELHLVRYEVKPKSADISKGILTSIIDNKEAFVSTKRHRSSAQYESTGPAHFKGLHEVLNPKAGEFILIVDQARKIVRLERLSTRSNLRYNRAPSKADVTEDPYSDKTHQALESKYGGDAVQSHNIQSLMHAPTGVKGKRTSSASSSSASSSSSSSINMPAPTSTSMMHVQTNISKSPPPPSIEARRSPALFDSSTDDSDDDSDDSDSNGSEEL